jgi:hypothetical protein
MKKNVGTVDRWIRIIRVALLSLIVFFPAGPLDRPDWFDSLLTGIAGYCPLYSLFKINTNKA